MKRFFLKFVLFLLRKHWVPDSRKKSEIFPYLINGNVKFVSQNVKVTNDFTEKYFLPKIALEIIKEIAKVKLNANIEVAESKKEKMYFIHLQK